MPKVKFNGLIFVPDGEQARLNLKEMIIPQENTQQLFVDLKRAVKAGNFKITVAVGGAELPPLTVAFMKVGQTAGWVAWTLEENETLKHMHGFTVLLSKLDADDDRRAVDTIRNFASLKRIKPELFDVPLKETAPVAATFFCDIESANYPVLYPMIKVLCGAFFDQFGINDYTP